MAPLGLLSRGEKAKISEIKGQKGCFHGSSRNQLSHAEDMGLRIGKSIEMLNNEGRCPIPRGQDCHPPVKKQKEGNNTELDKHKNTGILLIRNHS